MIDGEDIDKVPLLWYMACVYGLKIHVSLCLAKVHGTSLAEYLALQKKSILSFTAVM